MQIFPMVVPSLQPKCFPYFHNSYGELGIKYSKYYKGYRSKPSTIAVWVKEKLAMMEKLISRIVESFRHAKTKTSKGRKTKKSQSEIVRGSRDDSTWQPKFVKSQNANVDIVLWITGEDQNQILQRMQKKQELSKK